MPNALHQVHGLHDVIGTNTPTDDTERLRHLCRFFKESKRQPKSGDTRHLYQQHMGHHHAQSGDGVASGDPHTAPGHRDAFKTKFGV